MIGMIIGEVIEPGLVLAAGGVGYLVETPTTYQAGTQVRLYTHAVYREDAAQLYGFETRDELAVFTELISISGVGPKIAMAMLRKLGVGGVKRVFRDRDEQALTDLKAVEGIGGKTAEKLLALVKINTDGAEDSPKSKTQDSVTATLTRLGFKDDEIRQALEHVTETDDVSKAVNEALAALRDGRTEGAA